MSASNCHTLVGGGCFLRTKSHFYAHAIVTKIYNYDQPDKPDDTYDPWAREEGPRMHTSLVTYQVFLTRNSEYHLQSHVCVGVRDRRTGHWLEKHPALHRPLATTVRTAGQLAPLQKPQLGESLEFDLDGGAPLRTSPVLNIEERGGTTQRAVMAPRAAAAANSLLATTFPAMAPLPPPAPKAAPLGHVAKVAPAKSGRWPFRRRPRISTAERNLAQAQAQAQDPVTGPVRVATEPRRLARWRASWIRGRKQQPAAAATATEELVDVDQSGVHSTGAASVARVLLDRGDA